MNRIANESYKTTVAAAYVTSFSLALTSSLPPLLFLQFRDKYSLSFTQLGLLIVVNFGVQLVMDLIFSFFSHKFDLKAALRFTPAVITAGLIGYALFPGFFPSSAYLWLLIFTAVFSIGSGLSEVLISPLIAAIPTDDGKKAMARLHSVFAWGVVATVAFSTLYFNFSPVKAAAPLILILALLPLSATILFFKAPIPHIPKPEKVSGAAGLFRDPLMALCVLCIFFGGASELCMSQWCSGYLEKAFGLSKTVGDVLGVALFGAALGAGRTLYSKRPKNVLKTLLAGFIGAALCYSAAFIFEPPAVGLAACAFTGFCVSMLWPGSLLAAGEAFPQGGVAVYALLAAGGDLGGSVVPQLMGTVADAVIASSSDPDPERVGMRAAMAFGAVFPALGALTVAAMMRLKKK